MSVFDANVLLKIAGHAHEQWFPVPPTMFYEDCGHIIYLYVWSPQKGRCSVRCQHCLCDDDAVELHSFKFAEEDAYFNLCMLCWFNYGRFDWEEPNRKKNKS